MIRSIFFIVGSIIAALIQISFLNSFNFFHFYSNIILVLVIFIATTVNYRRGFLFALIAGLTLDCFSAFGFGCITFSMLLSIITIYYIFKLWVAHRSIYSVVLAMIIGNIVFLLSLWLLVNIFYWLNWQSMTISMDRQWFIQSGGQLAANIVVIIICYLATKFAIKKIRSRFFISDHS